MELGGGMHVLHITKIYGSIEPEPGQPGAGAKPPESAFLKVPAGALVRVPCRHVRSGSMQVHSRYPGFIRDRSWTSPAVVGILDSSARRTKNQESSRAKKPIPPGNSFVLVKSLVAWGDCTVSDGMTTLKSWEGYQ